MENLDRARAASYFARITGHFTIEEPPTVFLITHLLPERPAFVRAVASITDLRAVLPKPKSIDLDALRAIDRGVQCDELSRPAFANPDTAVRYLESRAAGDRVVLADVGGYFAPAIREICERFSGTILGVVEDTENGHRRYAELGTQPVPVISVARSPLKDPEDFLVGQSVVFSAEALMRSQGDIPHGRAALVLGFGKLGSSIARLLHAKGIRILVYDLNPVRQAKALSEGFAVERDRSSALRAAGLVLCATGSLSLRREDFSLLRNGAYVATVTSSDDELELDGLDDIYESTRIDPHVVRYTTTGQYFYLLNGGNAVNFLHGASVGPFIFLVQAEIIAGIRMIGTGEIEPGIHEVTEEYRTIIASTWLDYFNQ